MSLLDENKFKIGSAISQKDIDDIIFRCGDTLELGLGNGKMNLVLFFYVCELCFKTEAYGLLADDLLNDIYEEIGRKSILGLSEICGIGCGVEFLIQCGLVEGDSDVILAELDMKIMEQIPFVINDNVLLGKYEEYVCYILCRLLSPRDRQNTFYPFDKDYLDGITKFILREHCENRKGFFSLFISYMNGYDVIFDWNDVLTKSCLLNKYRITI